MPGTSILILGAGDFSAAHELVRRNSVYDAQKARLTRTEDHNSPRARSLAPGVSVLATEYRSHSQSKAAFNLIDKKRRDADPRLKSQRGVCDHWTLNLNHIQMMDGEIREGFDATRYPSGMGRFDRIIFENPHSGMYGSETDEVQNMRAVTSNSGLLEGIVAQAARHLTSHGTLEIAICGWPYQSKPSRRQKWDEGMGLEDPRKAAAFASNHGLKHVDTADWGVREVSRNDGEVFRANVLYLRFRLR